MLWWLILFLVVLLAGIALLLPLYGKLLRDLERHNEQEFDHLGRPSLFMHSPARGLQLQRFLYSGSRQPGIHPDVARLCRVLSVLTPVFVLVVLGVLVLGLLDGL